MFPYPKVLESPDKAIVRGSNSGGVAVTKVRYRGNHNILEYLKEKLQSMSLGMNPEEVSPEQCISHVFPLP
jgi:hypothetical protein